MHHIIVLLADITIENNGQATGGNGFYNGTLGGIGTSIVNTLLLFVGAISVIVLIISGLRYVLSAGNSSAVKSAKDGILYAIIGIVVAMSGYAISAFVSSRF